MKTKSIKIFFTQFLAILFILMSLHCGSGTTIVGNTSTNPTSAQITIGVLTSNSSAISIPLAAFGSTDADAESTNFTVYRNGSSYISSRSISLYYSSSTQVAEFTIPSLADNDLLTFLFERTGDDLPTFSGLVSDTTSTIASTTIAAEDLLVDANTLIQVTGTSSFEVRLERSIFGDSESDFENIATVTLTTDLGTTVTSAFDNYDASTDYVVITGSGNVDDITRIDLTATGGLAPFSPDIGDNLGVNETTTTLYRKGFVGTFTSSFTATYTLTETERVVSSGCPASFSGLSQSLTTSGGSSSTSSITVPSTMQVDIRGGSFVYMNGADDDRDWEGIIDVDGGFTLMDGLVASSGSDTSTGVLRIDGLVTETAISGSYAYYYDTPTLSCRVDIDFVGVAE